MFSSEAVEASEESRRMVITLLLCLTVNQDLPEELLAAKLRKCAKYLHNDLDSSTYKSYLKLIRNNPSSKSVVDSINTMKKEFYSYYKPKQEIT